jgi:hypothetical protein
VIGHAESLFPDLGGKVHVVVQRRSSAGSAVQSCLHVVTISHQESTNGGTIALSCVTVTMVKAESGFGMLGVCAGGARLDAWSRRVCPEFDDRMGP